MNKKLLSILAATATIIPTVLPVQAQNVDAGHLALGREIASLGVDFKINPNDCFTEEDGPLGWYWSAKNELVVCQENATRPNTEVRWTAEDFDTLRHEAQHLIQDCMDGKQNSVLGSVYKDPIRLGKEVLGNRGINVVREAYSDSSEHVITLEIEAFSVAALNKPLDQVNDIKHYCL